MGRGPAFDRTGKRVYNRNQYYHCGRRAAAAVRSGAGKERMSMDSKLFRKESLERISSPEALHDYMRVTSPKPWMVLAAVLFLAVGFVFYASTAAMEETLPVQVEVAVYNEGGETWSLVTAELLAENKPLVQPGMLVRFAGKKGKVQSVYETKNVVGMLIKTDQEPVGLPDGTYDGELVTESTSPLGFLVH